MRTERTFICPVCQKSYQRDTKHKNSFYCSKKCFGVIAAERKRNTEENFWLHVDKNGSNGCWIWKGRTDSWGYGRLTWHTEHKAAHRLAYELTFGPIPNNLLCCHHCDNPKCVNPYHIFLGTDADNMADKKSKGREVHPRGENHPSAKLTFSQVQEIREMYATGLYSYLDIAHKFSVAKSTIGMLIREVSWPT
jgi:predicted nucleic acid-binding Zn ribbon protein